MYRKLYRCNSAPANIYHYLNLLTLLDWHSPGARRGNTFVSFHIYLARTVTAQ